MAKRFLIAFALILFYIVAWAGLLYAVILFAREDEGLLLTAVLAMLAFLILAFVPYLDRVIKRAFYFAGEGQPISAAQLRRRILSVNHFRSPVMAEERVYDLVLTWNYGDRRWWETLSKAGLTRLYELHVKLDEKRRLATLIDVTKSVEWRSAPTQVKTRGTLFRRPILIYQLGKQWGIEENWESGTPDDARFVPTDIKNPVMNTILRSGWDVRFGIW
jgi:hypothetical protein